jgi:hypothetical protein
MEGAEHCGSKSARLIEDLDRVLAKLASDWRNQDSIEGGR